MSNLFRCFTSCMPQVQYKDVISKLKSKKQAHLWTVKERKFSLCTSDESEGLLIAVKSYGDIYWFLLADDVIYFKQAWVDHAVKIFDYIKRTELRAEPVLVEGGTIKDKRDKILAESKEQLKQVIARPLLRVAATSPQDWKSSAQKRPREQYSAENPPPPVPPRQEYLGTQHQFAPHGYHSHAPPVPPRQEYLGTQHQFAPPVPPREDYQHDPTYSPSGDTMMYDAE